MKINNTIINEKYVVFWNSIFSNFFPCSFSYKGMVFSSSEQALMWSKGLHFGDVQSCIKILEANTPKKAKELGRLVKNFNVEQWDKVRLGYMVEILVAKFGQNANLKDTLLKTGSRSFVEGSPYDKIWGIGIHWQDPLCLDESKWLGDNLLGKALDQAKEQLIQKG